MKTITIPPQSTQVNELLDHAREEDIFVRTADGAEFIVTAVDEFDREIALTRQNERLMALLDERARQEQTISLEEAKRQLGL